MYSYFSYCKGPEDDDFCETLSDTEPYYGYSGMLKCLRDGAGDVGFFHTRDIMMNFEDLSKEFDIVCKNKRLSLDWKNIMKKGCHLAEESPQVYKLTSFVRERRYFQVRNTTFLQTPQVL